MSKSKQGSLTVVGTGINALAQCSIESRSFIKHADIVYVLVTDHLTVSWIKDLNANVVNLQDLYLFTEHIHQDETNEPDVGRPRPQTYEAITETFCQAVREGKNVVAVFYGHPGVFVWSSHAAIRRLKEEGFRAQMLPGISAEDCLIADIGVDPCENGCAQYEATAFIYYRYKIDPSVGLILWQLGVLGDDTFQHLRPRKDALVVLTEKLLASYPPSHKLVIYEASNFPLGEPRIDWIRLDELPNATVGLASTIYIPPANKPQLDEVFIAKLNACPLQYQSIAPV